MTSRTRLLWPPAQGVYNDMKRKLWITGVLALTGLLVSGCAVTDIHGDQSMAASARWAQLPIANYAEAPQVGERAGAILAALKEAE